MPLPPPCTWNGSSCGRGEALHWVDRFRWLSLTAAWTGDPGPDRFWRPCCPVIDNRGAGWGLLICCNEPPTNSAVGVVASERRAGLLRVSLEGPAADEGAAEAPIDPALLLTAAELVEKFSLSFRKSGSSKLISVPR